MFDVLYMEDDIREEFLNDIKNTNVSEIVIRDISPLTTKLRFNLDIVESKYMTDEEKYGLLYRAVIRRTILHYGCETDIDMLTTSAESYITDELSSMYINDYTVNVTKLRNMINVTVEALKLIRTGYDMVGVFCVELSNEYDVRKLNKISVMFNILDNYLVAANFDKDKRNEVQLSYPAF